MLKTTEIGEALSSYGFNFYSGVPCSFLKDLINYAINHCNYISATNEGDAVATCAGAALNGEKTVMLMQNSGLGNTVSPLTSLIYTFKLPILMFCSLRGEKGIQDEPQHELMGEITSSLLKTMNINYAVLNPNINTALKQLDQANFYIEKGLPFCFIVKKNSFEPHKLERSQLPTKHKETDYNNINTTPLGSRTDALNIIKKSQPKHAVLLATTGKTGRELFELGHEPNHFYQVGSMGCISAIGLGLASSHKRLPTIVIDGDGAALMRLGSWATNGYYSPNNLCHILLDNEVHDSTGGQDTASKAVNFVRLASSMNYPKAFSVTSFDDLKRRLEEWTNSPQLTLIHVKINPGSPKKLGRPTLTPIEVGNQLKQYIKDTHD
ncbi:phosphonopyruvate decarboxylase [Candidatus Marinamargulisbacteria bacterium SCGC AG-343-D04]|nr:phosphonopyruvate decarboxylase [Candidatus Marinamargulisbacteria bacterium SCGC AG-343-D04]